ncbi:conserved hypothetical protein [Treponema phagedenis]|uniref:Uncharacterized protein n=1 Tax=Treponema phagedenis TaxID=162 RepID=A0A0B7GY59_TREPH|nr:conserved hypothetical protein [Treponema phagedenis]
MAGKALCISISMVSLLTVVKIRTGTDARVSTQKRCFKTSRL